MAVVENGLVRVEVLPEVGGHIWRIVDKKTQKNLLWTNDAVKPVRVGRRHGWIAGGIEFPFPVGNHGEDALEPYRWSIRNNADGSATATVSSFDHFYRFWGSYDVTLRPDDARVAVTVRLYNPTQLRNRYQLWVNAAVKVGDDMQYIFPTDYVTGHGFGGVYSWPTMDKDSDRSYWKNVEDSMGVFAWHADYLGAYYHNDDYGVIRYSPRTLTEGIKLWTWGTDSGWTREYSLDQGPYGEIQGGRWPTQTMYGWLDPHQMDTWTEYWYPVKGLGGVDQASRYAAMKVSVKRDGDKPQSAEMRINALVPVNGRLVVTAGDSTLLAKAVEIPAGEVLVLSVDISSLPADGAFNVSLVDATNLSLISHDVKLEAAPSPKPEAPADVRVEGEGPEWDALARGLARELNEDDLAGAGESYESTTREYPEFAPAWKALGILRHKQMDYEAALSALEKAAAIAADDLEARYYLGLTQLALGRPEYAETLASVTGDAKFAHAAKYILGREAAAAGDYAGAVKVFTEAGNGWSCDAALWSALAVSARKAGDAAAAAEALEAAMAAEPLNAFAMVEGLFAGGKAAPEAVREALGRDSDLYVETALFYSGLGCAAEALETAKAGETLADSGLYFYYLSYFAGKAGDRAAALSICEEGGVHGHGLRLPEPPGDARRARCRLGADGKRRLSAVPQRHVALLDGAPRDGGDAVGKPHRQVRRAGPLPQRRARVHRGPVRPSPFFGRRPLLQGRRGRPGRRAALLRARRPLRPDQRVGRARADSRTGAHAPAGRRRDGLEDGELSRGAAPVRGRQRHTREAHVAPRSPVMGADAPRNGRNHRRLQRPCDGGGSRRRRRQGDRVPEESGQRAADAARVVRLAPAEPVSRLSRSQG